MEDLGYGWMNIGNHIKRLEDPFPLSTPQALTSGNHTLGVERMACATCVSWVFTKTDKGAKVLDGWVFFNGVF